MAVLNLRTAFFVWSYESVKRFAWIIAAIALLGLTPKLSRALQMGSGGFGRADVGNLRVRITFTNDRAATVQARVRLYAAGTAR